MKIAEYLTEAFEKKQLEPVEGNTYSVKGTTTKGLDVYIKYARFIGTVKNSDGEWVYAFRRMDTGGNLSFKKPFVLGPPNWK